VGSIVGSAVGSVVGSTVGSVVGSTVGSIVGSALGSVVGSTVGSVVGSTVGSIAGSIAGGIDTSTVAVRVKLWPLLSDTSTASSTVPGARNATRTSDAVVGPSKSAAPETTDHAYDNASPSGSLAATE
jgi:phage tail tape-measure protein